MSETRTLSQYRDDKHGTVRVEEWPEGLVLWVGGEIAWRQWRPQSHQVITLKLDCSELRNLLASQT